MAGLDLSYAIDVHNNGPTDAIGVSVTDTLPAGVTFVSMAAFLALRSETVHRLVMTNTMSRAVVRAARLLALPPGRIRAKLHAGLGYRARADWLWKRCGRALFLLRLSFGFRAVRS